MASRVAVAHKAARTVVVTSGERDDKRVVPGTVVGDFRVIRNLGRGGMGEVFLARDLNLGRRVALKMIRRGDDASLADDDDFLKEARATARFTHPNIVTIHQVGRHGPYLYLALEYLDGDNLRQRMRAGKLSLPEIEQVGLSLARGLAEAHRNRILHKDLKPENVLLCSSGAIKIVDFGVSQEIDEANTVEYTASGKAVVRGSPAYLSPEQWETGVTGTSSDVWALGVVLHEMVVGHRPYRALNKKELSKLVRSPEPVPVADELREIPRALADLILQCLEKNPSDRPAAAQIAEVLENLKNAKAASIGAEFSPYRGLLPFTERHASLFFGRDSEIAEFLERIRIQPLLPVVGPSGAGKSSLVRAGFVPSIHERGSWIVLSMRPGMRPFEALAAQLISGGSTSRFGSDLSIPSSSRLGSVRRVPESVAPRGDGVGADEATTLVNAGGVMSQDDASGLASMAPCQKDAEGGNTHAQGAADIDVIEDSSLLAAQLFKRPGLLGMKLREMARETGSNVLLFVDQMEELYTVVRDSTVQQRFMTALCLAADDAMEPVRVCFTLRDDFLGRAATSAEARAALSRVTVIRSPGPEELRDILLKPLAAAGYSFDDPQVVDDMIREVAEEANNLPLLQFTARVLWERRDQKRLQILRSAYEDIGGVAGALADHSDKVLAALSSEEIMIARQVLLRLVTHEGTRRVVAWKDLADNLGPSADDVLRRLVASRLLAVTQHRDGVHDDADVELVHESLITRWGRLARWIHESRDERVLVADIAQAAALWDKRGRRPQETWHGDDLRQARRAVENIVAGVPSLVVDFLDAGVRQETLGRQRMRRRRMIAIVAVVGIVAASVLVAGTMARQRQEADYQRHRADERRAEALRERAQAQWESARAAIGRGEMLSARAKVRTSLETMDSPMARGLWWKLSRNPVVWRREFGSFVYRAVFAPDGQTVATVGQDGSIRLIDVDTLSTKFLRGHKDQVVGVEYSHSGKSIASIDWSGRVFVWDVARRTGRTMPIQRRSRGTPEEEVVFSPDDRYVFTAHRGGWLSRWDLNDGDKPHDEHVCPRGRSSANFSTDGKFALIDCVDHQGKLLSLPTMKTIQTIPHSRGVSSFPMLGPRGRFVLVGDHDKRLSVLDLKTNKRRLSLPRLYGSMIPAFSLSGRFVAYSASDLSVQVWDTITGIRTRRFDGYESPTYGVRFSPDSRRMLFSQLDKTVTLVSLDKKSAKIVGKGHDAQVYGVDITKDGKHIATSGMDGTIRVWETVSGKQTGVFSCNGASVAVAFGQQGKFLYGGCGNDTISVWDWRHHARAHVIHHDEGPAQSLITSPDGQFLALGSQTGSVALLDMATERTVRRHRLCSSRVTSLSFSPDSRLLAAAGESKTVKIWDTRSGKLAYKFSSFNQYVYGTTFGRGGNTLFMAGGSGKVRAWDLIKDNARVVYAHSARTFMLGLSPDGHTLGVPSSDMTAFTLNLDTGAKVTFRGHRNEVNALRFVPGGKEALTTSDDGTVRLWDVATGRSMWRTTALLHHPMSLLSHNGWEMLDADRGDQGAVRSSFEGAKWKAFLETSAERAYQSPDDKLLCVKTLAGHLAALDITADAVLFDKSEGEIASVLAVPNGCVAIVGSEGNRKDVKRAVLVDRAGKRTELASSSTAISWTKGHILVASPGHVMLFDEQGHRQETKPGVKGVSAIGQVGEWIVLGNKDGNMQLVSVGQHRQAPSFMFESVPSSQVVRLMEGPMNTIIAAYSNGLVGMWTTLNGVLIHHVKLHGAVTHMMRQGDRLYVATELGDHAAIDLSVFSMDYCGLLRQIWRTVPVVWRNGLPVRESPAGHRCYVPGDGAASISDGGP